MNSSSLTTREVARLCRVSDATVKRWESAGLIASERTNGGHRRFRAEDIARFQQKNLLGVKQKHGHNSVVIANTRRRPDKSLSDCSFFHALVSGSEEDAANRLINEFLNDTSLPQLFDGLVCRTLNHIGELWAESRLSVAQEHLATRTVMASILKLRSVVPVSDPCNELSFCMAVEGDFHEIPTHLAQITLENEGWEVMNFGANTPLYCIAEEVKRHKPKIICISATTMQNIERVSHDYNMFAKSIAKTGAKILLGGRSFSRDNLGSRFEAHYYPKNFTEVAQIAGELISNE